MDPTGVVVQARRGSPVEMMVRAPDTALGTESLTLVQVGRGDFTLRWRAEHGRSGPSQLDVFLAGDSNGDFRVDDRDLLMIRASVGARTGDPRYLVDILPRLSTMPATDLGQLAPHRWTKPQSIAPST